jgi:transposase
MMILRAQNVVYVDESGLNRHYRRMFARARRGARVHAKRPGKRVKKVNIIGGLLYGLHGKKYIAVRNYEHTTNSKFFENWFEWELLGVVPENSIIIMDNASFHRKSVLIEIAAKYGVVVLFLPPYSPNLNPIEKSWANFKRWLNDNWSRFPSIDFAVDYYFGEFCY